MFATQICTMTLMNHVGLLLAVAPVVPVIIAIISAAIAAGALAYNAGNTESNEGNIDRASYARLLAQLRAMCTAGAVQVSTDKGCMWVMAARGDKLNTFRFYSSENACDPATTITLVFAADGESISMFSGDQHLQTLKARFMAAEVDKLINAKLACSY